METIAKLLAAVNDKLERIDGRLSEIEDCHEKFAAIEDKIVLLEEIKEHVVRIEKEIVKKKGQT